MGKRNWERAADDHDFAPYVVGRPAASVEMFWRFVAIARECGPIVFELQPEVVALRGTRRLFGSVRLTKDGIGGHLNLIRSVTDRRVTRVEPLTKQILLHRFLVKSVSDLDGDFAGWLCEAAKVGNGVKPAR